MTDVLGVGAGDRVTLMLGARKIIVTVATVIGGTGPLGGATLLADPADLDRLGAPRQPTGVLADVPGDRKKAVEAARAALHGTNVQMDLLAEERDLVNSFINGLTGVALGLLGLTVIIAVVGVGTTTALSVVERTRESGMLRAVGLSRAGLRATVAIEAGLYGVVGSALGLVLGVPYAWLTVYALDLGAPLVAPVAQLAAVVVVLAGLTILAGLLPARRAARVSPVAALAVE
jgi:putative ABC transport system permease protein